MNARRFNLILYVAGESPNSRLAVMNLNALVANNLPTGTTVEIVDVFRDPQRAIKDDVLLTPTLKVQFENVSRLIVGNLSDTEIILNTLGLVEVPP